MKLGERLLFSAFKYAVEHEISYVYLHTYGEEHEMLVSLCQDDGFVYAGKYDGRDDVYLKHMLPPVTQGIGLRPLEYAVKFYPHYLDTENIGKYIIPIKPEYHNDLFADISDNAQGLFADDPSMYSPQSNTIKKAYICHSNTAQIKEGDLLLFYRTHDRKSIECIGIVEQIYRGSDVNKVLPIVSKRTVYSKTQVEVWLQRETLVLLFRLLRTFSPIDYETLKQANIKGPFQSIRKITHEQYIHCFPRSLN